MKKIISLICLLLLLVGCNNYDQIENDKQQAYQNMIDLLSKREAFEDNSPYFDITLDIAKTSDGYRYYITLDNPIVAMYNVQMIAIEKEEDYSNKMAACAGIFEDTSYSLIPNQLNPSAGFVKGINISGISKNDKPVVYLLVLYNDSESTLPNQCFLRLDYANIGE